MGTEIMFVRACEIYGEEGLLLDDKKFRRMIVRGFNKDKTVYCVREIYRLGQKKI